MRGSDLICRTRRQPGNPFMARETVYVVQTYVAGKGSQLKADVPISCKSAEDAFRRQKGLDLPNWEPSYCPIRQTLNLVNTPTNRMSCSGPASCRNNSEDRHRRVPMAPELYRLDGSCAPQSVGSRSRGSS